MSVDLDKLLRNPAVCATLLKKIDQTLAGRTMRFMEVCGTHTVSIFRSGLRSLLPATIKHISGPGCPVCVTHDSEIDMAMRLAARENVIIATFGDMLRVPGPDGQSLRHAAANGATVKIVYSSMDALTLARENPLAEVIFLGIGFETTAPTVAASILAAQSMGVGNYSVLSFHKLVPPALRALLSDPDCVVDAFLLPGHVCTITGLTPFAFLPDGFGKPAAVGGFEPADILMALLALAEQHAAGKPRIVNTYERAVDVGGNAKASQLMERVFTPCAANWRGLGKIESSGLAIREDFAAYDACRKFDLHCQPVEAMNGCRCGDVLKGRLEPEQCPLFGRKCTPAFPVGPCMVSTEGSCAAHFRYGGCK